MITPFRRIVSLMADVNRLQDSCDFTFKDIIAKQILDGNLIEDIVLGTNAVQVNHKLDKKITGWVVVRQNADATIWDEQSTNKTPDRTLVLKASAAVTVSLWVF